MVEHLPELIKIATHVQAIKDNLETVQGHLATQESYETLRLTLAVSRAQVSAAKAARAIAELTKG